MCPFRHRILSLLLIFGLTLPLCSCHDEEGNRPRVLWLGTSIPAGCTYPRFACDQLGLQCVNRSISASFLTLSHPQPPFYPHSGYSLTMTTDEKRQYFRPYLAQGIIDSSLLEDWFYASYDHHILSDIRRAEYIVIDHGYNDAQALQAAAQLTESDIDWNSEDRSTYFGAFNYLYRIIRQANPQARVIVGGYFQHACTIDYLATGQLVAHATELIAQHYQLPLLDVWHYVDIPDGYCPGSAGYLSDLNRRYGTQYQPIFTDAEGNITYFQQFCPDGVHPFSDPSGRSDSILNQVVTSLLEKAIR